MDQSVIEKYLTEDQMREIAVEEWRSMCREACDGNAERIVGNIAHDVAFRIVAEALGDDANELIKAKAIALIDDLSAYLVFRRADAWDRSESKAYAVLMDAVKANSDLVDKKIRDCIAQLSKRDALEILKSGKIQINAA